MAIILTIGGGVTKPVPTLFGKGPEVYVSPSMGGPHIVVRVIGLGFPAKTSVDISALDPTAGCGGAGCPYVARTRAGGDGIFRVRFRMPPYPSAFTYTPLVVAAWSRTGKLYASTIFVIVQQAPNS